MDLQSSSVYGESSSDNNVIALLLLLLLLMLIGSTLAVVWWSDLLMNFVDEWRVSALTKTFGHSPGPFRQQNHVLITCFLLMFTKMCWRKFTMDALLIHLLQS
jgi:hypothetical protein